MRDARSLVIATALLASTSVLGACGPASYIYTVTNEARRLVAEAKTAGAKKLAPYEYWSAVTYLRMAREMASFGDWRVAVKYGDRAVKMGKRARKLCDDRRKDGPGAKPPPPKPKVVLPKKKGG